MINPSPEAFSVFGFSIRWYGILITLGVIAGILLAMKAAPKYGWTQDDIIDMSLIAVPLGILGARLYFVLFYDPAYYLANPLQILMTWKGGLAVYGGIIGGIAGAIIYCRWKKRKVLDLLDIGMPSIALGQAIGRWGNFFNQEAFGAQITDPKLMWFPFAVKINATNTIHYATFFYESMWCFIIVISLVLLRKRFKHSGDVLLGYVLMYSFERMLVEGLRTDSLMIGSLRVSQLLSGLLFACALAFIVLRYIKEKGAPAIITNKLNPLYGAANAEQAEVLLQDEPSESGELGEPEYKIDDADDAEQEEVLLQDEHGEIDESEYKIDDADDAKQE